MSYIGKGADRNLPLFLLINCFIKFRFYIGCTIFVSHSNRFTH
nr:MAG TPA: hypothetical protein [Bacteriophage sp.]